MMSRLAAFIATFVAAAGFQTTPATMHGSNHFYWSETKAHELDYKHTIATADELSPVERKNLLAFMFNRFRSRPKEHQESMFEGIPDDQLRRLAANTRIEFVDLNGDETRQIIAQGNGIGPCGATGNCIVMLLEKTLTGWKTLLDTHAQFGGGFEKIRMLDTFTNGYRNIVLADHDSACKRTASVLTYDKKRYRERECYHISSCTAGGTARLPKPEIEACPK
jgi:hypothetical protein